ncbi:MAG: GntR family transcriptional regulator [Cyanobacteria bacterium P01_D01_bin.14]
MTSLFMVPSEPSAQKQPLHVAISEILKEKIENGQYDIGERLPSEFDLGAAFGVSRTTIRKAISNLIQQGLVTTQRGKGIFVSGRKKITFSISNPLIHFDRALQAQGYVGRIHSLRFQKIEAPTDVAGKLQIAKSAPVYWQEKIIYADESPIALEIDYFPESIGSGLAAELQHGGFTYSTLNANGIHLNAGRLTMESVPATYELSEYLAVPLGMPLLVFSFVVYSGDRQPAACGKTISRSDWTCYTSEMGV